MDIQRCLIAFIIPFVFFFSIIISMYIKRNNENIKKKVATSNTRIKNYIIEPLALNFLFLFLIYFVPFITAKIPEDILEKGYERDIRLNYILIALGIAFPYLVLVIYKALGYTKKFSLLKEQINMIYSITLVFGFLSLLWFTFTGDSQKDISASIVSQYLVAPFGMLLGEIIPYDCFYSKDGLLYEIKNNFRDKFFFKGDSSDNQNEYRKKSAAVIILTLLSNIIVSLIFNNDTFMRKLDGYVVTAVALGILLSPVPVLIIDKVVKYKENHWYDDFSN